MTEKEIREQAWADGYEYGKSVATINMPRLIKEAQEQERERILAMMNMRDVGGINPEWALSDKDYQAIQQGS